MMTFTIFQTTTTPFKGGVKSAKVGKRMSHNQCCRAPANVWTSLTPAASAAPVSGGWAGLAGLGWWRVHVSGKL